MTEHPELSDHAIAHLKGKEPPARRRAHRPSSQPPETREAIEARRRARAAEAMDGEITLT